MKFAEALKERADIQTRIGQMQVRLSLNARVQEGEKPSEDPAELLRELDELISRLEELIRRINITNASTQDEGVTLTVLMAKRDCLRKKTDILRSFLNEASDIGGRATYSEIKMKSTVNVAKKRKELDKLSEELRQTDGRIQQLNWLTDLL